MELESNYFDHRNTSIFYVLVLILNLVLQLLIIIKVPSYSFVLLVVYNLCLVVPVFYRDYIQSIPTMLLIINFLPLVYLNNIFHYSFGYEVFFSAPLILLVLLAIFKYISRLNNLSFSLGYIGKPIFILVIYFTIVGAVDVYNGQSLLWIVQQLFHFYLYLLFIPIYYLVKDRKHFQLMFYFLLVISIVISLEYLIINKLLSSYRFVTFQSGFLPLVSGILFSYLLFRKRFIKRIIVLSLLVVVIVGTFVTLTRTLWLVTALNLLMTLILFLKVENKLNLSKLVMILLMLLFPLLMISDINNINSQERSDINSLQYRTQSVTNPLEDASFLMRIEFSYYAIQKFLDNPIFGKGLGDYLKYKIVFLSNLPNYYLDNSWFYFLWKGGIVGFLLFLWVYIRFFKAAYFVSKNSTDIKTKYICIGLLAGFIELSLLAFLSPILIKYKTNALIAFAFAYIEYERRSIINNKIQN